MIAPPETPCFSNIEQEFLVCTTVHKAKHLGVFQGDILVRVVLDKSHRQTKVFSNSENPFFNEYFVFDVKTTLSELLRMAIMYEVKRRTTCKKDITLGELLVDMQSVWLQPNHCYFKRWGRLEIPIGYRQHRRTGYNEEKGYLQIDLAIITQTVSTNLLRSMDTATYRLLLNNNISMGPGAQFATSDKDSKKADNNNDNNTSSNNYSFEQKALSIISHSHLFRDYDDIQTYVSASQMQRQHFYNKRNLLTRMEANMRCNIRYNVVFFKGYMVKRNDYFIQFRFHPFKGKTKVIKSTHMPVWNQDITFTWTYPSLAQTFLIQLLSREHLQWKCISEYELHFDEIAFNDTPSLGPTYIHFHDNGSGWRYVGRVLMQIRSECIKHISNRELRISTVPRLQESDYWREHKFQIEFIALQGDFVHYGGSTCKISIRLAEKQSNYLECYFNNYSKKNLCKHFTSTSPFKAIYIHIALPDNRSKYEGDYCLIEIYEFVKSELELFQLFCIQYAFHYQSQVKVLRSIIFTIIHRLTKIVETERLKLLGDKRPTQWDVNRLNYLQEYFANLIKIYRALRNRLRPHKGTFIDIVIKEVVQDLMQRSYELHKVMEVARVQDEWPDLMLVMNANGREIGCCRLNARNFLFPPKDRELSSSNQCWKKNNFIFKSNQCQHSCSNCGCVMAVIQGCLSIVAEVDQNDFTASISNDWIQQEPHYWKTVVTETHFKCRIFLHQAKVRPGNDPSGLCDPFVRLMICNQSADTPVIYETLSPIWNTVIGFDHIVLPGPFNFYINNPPLLILEMFDTDVKTAEDYLGCGHSSVSVITSEWAELNVRHMREGAGDHFSRSLYGCEYKNSIEKFQCLKALSPPPLKWLPIIINGSIRAEVLLSAEIVEIASLDSVTENDAKEGFNITIGIPAPIRPNMRNFILQVIFVGLRNYQKIYGVGVGSHHRIKVMMGDLLLVSGISSPRIRHSINFLTISAAGVVSLPDQLDYWPAIVATDVSISNRGTETTLGAVLISDCKQYLKPYKEYKCQHYQSKPHKTRAVGDSSYNGDCSREGDTSTTSTMIRIDDDDDDNFRDTEPLMYSKSKQSTSTWDNVFTRYFFPAGVQGKKSTESGFLWRSDNTSSKPSNHSSNDTNSIEMEYTWWTKFYNSNRYINAPTLPNKHHLRVFNNELEKQGDFSYLIDWAEPLKLVHGVKYKKHAVIKEEAYATLKLHIRLMPQFNSMKSQSSAEETVSNPKHPNIVSARYQRQLQTLSEMVKILVRIYLVQGINFRPHEKHLEANAYIKMKFGSKCINNRAQVTSNGNNPIFGECFELEGILPREHLVEISAINRTTLRDDLVGTTIIDVEDRWRSQHRATVGIANEYSSSGYNRWRNSAPPSEILKELCINNDVNLPRYTEDFIEIDGVRLTDSTRISQNEDIKQRLALVALKKLDQLPSFGFKLVPEHVETRSLYRDDVPGIEQGKLQLWLELYDANLNIPPPIDIMPDPPLSFELRVVIHQCSEVILDERNIFGTPMSDIYVKGWFANSDEPQFTDTHYRSLNGDGKFNWRMIFPVKYSPIEDMAVIKRQSSFSETYDVKMPPVLYLQVFDNDLISEDDFLGSIEIHLSHMEPPFPTAKLCTLNRSEENRRNLKSIFTLRNSSTVQIENKYLDLFKEKKIRGWFPLKGHRKHYHKKHKINNELDKMLTGKIELEMEVLTAADAEHKPVGIGRHPPHALPDPERPKTSFNPWLHPLKTISHILLPQLMKLFFFVLVVVVVGLMLFFFFMRSPLIITGGL